MAPEHDEHTSHQHRPDPATDPETFWNDLYAARDQVWSGRPNHFLLELVEALPVGRALDLGCGEGGDAVWLAERGWEVTAVDVSATALGRSAAAANRLGLPHPITWQRHDLAETFPDGRFDLVSAQFLQSPIDFPRDEVLRRAADAVAPGGHLIVVAHAAMPEWSNHEAPPGGFPTAAGTVETLALDGDGWTIAVAEERERAGTGPDGQHANLVDSVVMARRTIPGPPR